MKKNISYNGTAIVNQGGQVSSITISRAIEIGTVDKNITTASLEEDEDYRPDCFYVIPLTEGTIKVRLVGGREDYTISEAEVTAQDFSDCALISEHDSTWSSMKTSVLLWKPVKDDIPDKTLYPHFFYNQGVLVSTSGNLKSPLTDFLAIPYLNVGVTSQRPGNADNGFQFFDVTLRKPIWWNGSSWVDANGATV